jgi:hypothetical protein
MNWIKRNLALTAILAVGLLATSAIGYLTLSASSAASEKSAALKSEADKLARLQNSKPAPSTENVDLLNTQSIALEDLAGKLENRLLESNINPTTLSETAFQDALNKLIRDVKSKAQDIGTLISTPSPDFALDFDRFTKEVPKQNLLPTLSRQLAESEFLINLLLKHQPIEIRRFEREKSPEEDPTFKPKPLEPVQKTAITPKKNGPKEAEPEPKPLPPFQSKTYHITILSRPETVRGLVGDLSESKKPFAIVRSIAVTNEKKDGPKRKQEPITNAENPDSQQSLYIVGEERIETSLSVEILTFRETSPTAKTSDGTAVKAK